MYSNCQLCPRKCKKNRSENELGICQVNGNIKIARAALHYWEEPCISGENGSGAVFFSGCPLHCVFCQNEEISHGKVGEEISIERLADIFLELQNKGANNINLVTATHYVPSVVCAIELSRNEGLNVPIIYNSSGYESLETMQLLEGHIDVYLPDLKYMKPETAKKYSHAVDYPDVAMAAINEMVRQKSELIFDEDGFIKQGVIVRNLLLPGHVNESKEIIQCLYNTYGDKIFISIMSQFTPMDKLVNYPEINRRVTKREYNMLVDYAINLGVENAFIQDRKVAAESFIPDFNGEGI